MGTMEKYNSLWAYPVGEYHRWSMVTEFASASGSQGQGMYKEFIGVQKFLGAGITFNGCTSTKVSTTAFCVGACGT